MSDGVLIVGASQAGVQVAASLRDLGYAGRVTLVGAEADPPYQRPPLSKGFLAGNVDIAALELRSPEYFRRCGIDLILGERVVDVGMDAVEPETGGTVQTDQGRTIRFDRLALTTGARPRRLSVPGSDLDGVCYLRDVDDANRLRALMSAGSRLVVIGGGFVGLETAAIAVRAGLRVTVVEAAPHLMARSVTAPVSEFYEQAHCRRGVEIRLDCVARAFLGRHGRVTGVVLATGEVLAADAVMVGVGVDARTELAERLGLACAGGIQVDDHARTSRPPVVAAGDCAVVAHPRSPGVAVRLESVPSAIAQARTAAASIAGRPVPGRDIPWFWSDQYDLKLQMAGLADDHDTVVVRGRPEEERFSVLCFRHERLTAVHAINSLADFMAGRIALARNISVTPDLAANSRVSLRDLVGMAGGSRV